MSSQGSSQPTSVTVENARLAKIAAQAKYYRARAEKLRKKQPILSTEVIVQIAIQIAGTLVSVISVVAVAYNAHGTVAALNRSREDTAFYESLKRMGDKDSAVVRASAAPLLALQSDNPAYYPAARSQLIHSLLLESDPVVLGAIQDSCLHLLDKNRDDMLPRLKAIYDKLQFQILDPLARVATTKDADLPKPVDDAHWFAIDILIQPTQLSRADLEPIIDKYQKTFFAYRVAAFERAKKMSDVEQATALANDQRELKAAALRLAETKRLLNIPEKKNGC